MSDPQYIPANPGTGKLFRKVRSDKGKRRLTRWQATWRVVARAARDVVEIWSPGVIEHWKRLNQLANDTAATVQEK